MRRWRVCRGTSTSCTRATTGHRSRRAKAAGAAAAGVLHGVLGTATAGAARLQSPVRQIRCRRAEPAAGQSRGPGQISARGVIKRHFPPWRKQMDTEMCHGAVLTYARRYTLFALVGIDDLDASDLATPMKPGPASRAEKSKGRAGIGQTGRARIFPQ